jgi:hypothetical protein
MTNSRTINEGIRAGILGAAVVAVWFVVVDLIMGRPLYTPMTLGEALRSIFGPVPTDANVQLVVMYTVVHFAVFILVGVLAAWIMNASEGEPGHLAGLFLLFIVFEAGFYLYLYLLAQNGRFVDIAWYQIGAANLLSAFAMGRYLFRAHPGSLQAMDKALAGR